MSNSNPNKAPGHSAFHPKEMLLELGSEGWAGTQALHPHGKVLLGSPSPAPARAFICMCSRDVPDRLHMQHVGMQSWKKKVSPKASDFQKK